MRAFTLASVALTAILPIAGASIIDFGPTIFAKINSDLTSKNHYGSPIPPWKPGSKPGWYYGPNPGQHPGIPCLGSDVCNWLNYFPGALHCPPKYPPHYPPPPPHHTTTTSRHSTSTKPTSTTPTPTPTPTPTGGYTPTFQNITSAVQADDFLTFGLVETIQDCEDMCDNVQGCGFVNTYHDVNGKGGSPLLTCSLFASCHGAEDADNAGGQTQPDGSVDFIINSDGWCKVV